MSNLQKLQIQNNQIFILIKDIEYIINIIETNNKNIYLTYSNETFILKKPLIMNEEATKKFIVENIEKFIIKIKKNNYQLPELWNIDAGWFLLFGKKENFYIKTQNIKFLIIGNNFEIAIDDVEIVTIKLALKQLINQMLLKKMLEITRYVEAEMKAIKHKVIIRQKKRSWATNIISKKTISYNLKLAHFDEKYLNYVAIHEVAHSFEANHSPAFWKIVARYSSNWKKLRSKLNKYEVY